MTSTGSDDAARELLALDEAGDAAPPDRRSLGGFRRQCRCQFGPGGEGTGSGATSRRAQESRRCLDAWEGVGGDKHGE